MSIEGRIAIDVSFADSATSDGVQSLKKISLTDTTSYTTGKVAVLTGTCGTAAVTVAQLGNNTPYRDAGGSEVSFVEMVRFAVSSSSGVLLEGEGKFSGLGLAASSQKVAVCDAPPISGLPPLTGSVTLRTVAGTASYTLVLYGT